MSGSQSSKLDYVYDHSTGKFTTVTKSPTIYVNESPKLPLLPIGAEKKQFGVGAGHLSYSSAHPSKMADPAPIGASYTSANSYANVMGPGTYNNNNAAGDYRPHEFRDEESAESLVRHAAPPGLGGNWLNREHGQTGVGGYRERE